MAREGEGFLPQLNALLESFRSDFLEAQGGIARQLAQLMETVAVAKAEPGEGVPAALEQTVAELKTEIAQLRNQEAWIIAANQDLSERLVALRAENKNGQQLLSEAYEEVKRLRDSLAAAETRAATEAQELREANAALHDMVQRSEEQIETIERQQRVILSSLSEDGLPRKIGEILILAGIITQAQLEEALDFQAGRTEEALGEILVNTNPAIEQDVAQSLACQFHMPFIRLDPRMIDCETARALGHRACITHKCMPLHAPGRGVVLAMADPRDNDAAARVQKKLGRSVIPVVSAPSEVVAAIISVFEA